MWGTWPAGPAFPACSEVAPGSTWVPPGAGLSGRPRQLCLWALAESAVAQGRRPGAALPGVGSAQGQQGCGPRPGWRRRLGAEAPPRPAGPCVTLRPVSGLVPSGPGQRRRGVAGAHQAGDGLGLTSAPLLPTQLLAAAAVPCPSSWEVRSVTANTSSGRTAAVPAQPCGGRHVPQPPSSSDPLSTPRNCGSGRLGGRGSGQERPSPGPAPDTACSGHWPLARSLGSVSLPPGEPPAPWGAATPSPWEWLPFLLQ